MTNSMLGIGSVLSQFIGFRGRLLKILITFTCLAMLIGGCASNRGAAEFAAFRDAIHMAQAASDSILDRLAVAERDIWRWCTNFYEIDDFRKCERFQKGRTPIRAAHASFVSKASDPPGTAAFRRAHTALMTYTEALHGLASGATASETAGRVEQIIGLATTAATVIAPAIGAVGTVSKAISSVNENVADFKPAVTAVLGQVTNAELRDQLLAHGPTMRQLIDELIAGVDRLGDTIRIAAILQQPSGTGGRATRDRHIEEMRVLISNYVVMLQTSRVTLDAAIAETGDRSTTSVGATLFAAQNLLLAAEETRRALAGDIGQQ